MIERLLAAERALEAGDLDRADHLFGQVADADSRNAIAVVGLAAVAHRRGLTGEASELVERALRIDPDDGAAERLRALLSAAVPAGSGSSASPAGEAVTMVAAAERPVPKREVGTPRRSFAERLRAWFRRSP